MHLSPDQLTPRTRVRGNIRRRLSRFSFFTTHRFFMRSDSLATGCGQSVSRRSLTSRKHFALYDRSAVVGYRRAPGYPIALDSQALGAPSQATLRYLPLLAAFLSPVCSQIVSNA